MHCFLVQKTELTAHSNSCDCGVKSVSDFCHFIDLLRILNMGHYFIWQFTSTLHSERFLWWHVAGRSPPLQFAVSRDQQISVKCTVFSKPYIKMRWKYFPSSRRHASHITTVSFSWVKFCWALQVRRREAPKENFQTKYRSYYWLLFPIG